MSNTDDKILKRLEEIAVERLAYLRAMDRLLDNPEAFAVLTDLIADGAEEIDRLRKQERKRGSTV